MLLTGVLTGCNLYGPLNNTVDPNSTSYIGTPANLAPSGSVHSVKPVLTWQNLSGSTYTSEYRIEVANDNSFFAPIVNQTTSALNTR